MAADRCPVCDGSGLLLMDPCPLCEPTMPASSASAALAPTYSAVKSAAPNALAPPEGTAALAAPSVLTTQPIMMKIWLSPKFECQLLKHISNGDDQGIVKDICMPPSSHRHIVIACCQGFSAHWPGCNDAATLRANFQLLHDMWTPGKYHVEIRRFSFKDEIEHMTELLNAATIFFVAGVHGHYCTTLIDVATEHIQQLIARLKQKVH